MTSAVRKAVLALANEGHRKIAIIIGDKENILSVQRFEGYLEGLKKAGIPYDEEPVFRGTYTRVSGYRGDKTDDCEVKAAYSCNYM